MAEPSQLATDIELSSGQLQQQLGQHSSSLGRSNKDLGDIGDSITGTAASSENIHDNQYNLQMLETNVSGPMAEASQLATDIELSPVQPLQLGQHSSSLGRSNKDLGDIGDSITGTAASSENIHDYQYNLQMLEAAFFKLPQPKDSEQAYTPRNPAATALSYPQVQAQILKNPAFWERAPVDTLFFSFYYQSNAYQQYLAARELKRRSWRYHRELNTWFHRHGEPTVTTDDYEKGTYLYFDFHAANEDPNQGRGQRIKEDCVLKYKDLEDELGV